MRVFFRGNHHKWPMLFFNRFYWHNQELVGRPNSIRFRRVQDCPIFAFANIFQGTHSFQFTTTVASASSSWSIEFLLGVLWMGYCLFVVFLQGWWWWWHSAQSCSRMYLCQSFQFCKPVWMYLHIHIYIYICIRTCVCVCCKFQSIHASFRIERMSFVSQVSEGQNTDARQAGRKFVIWIVSRRPRMIHWRSDMIWHDVTFKFPGCFIMAFSKV